jgi:hypothetical protein
VYRNPAEVGEDEEEAWACTRCQDLNHRGRTLNVEHAHCVMHMWIRRKGKITRCGLCFGDEGPECNFHHCLRKRYHPRLDGDVFLGSAKRAKSSLWGKKKYWEKIAGKKTKLPKLCEAVNMS